VQLLSHLDLCMYVLETLMPPQPSGPLAARQSTAAAAAAAAVIARLLPAALACMPRLGGWLASGCVDAGVLSVCAGLGSAGRRTRLSMASVW